MYVKVLLNENKIGCDWVLPTNEVLQRLSKVKETGPHQYRACCPAHQDKEPSLSIKDEKGSAVLHCQAGCDYYDIIKALGFSFENTAEPKRLDEYIYMDKNSVPQFRKRRTQNKRFFMQHPVDLLNDKWEKGLGNAMPVLYNLPSVLVARDNYVPIFIVEGEKDANTLIDYGYVATTNFEGASVWRDDYSKDFEGATVIIIPDYDAAGAKHAVAVADSVVRYAQSVKLIDLAKIWSSIYEKADITDYISYHDDKVAAWQTFDELVITTEEYIRSSDVCYNLPTRPQVAKQVGDNQEIKYAVNGLLSQGLSLLAAPPKTGKSFLALQLGLAVSQGNPILDFETCQANVLYVVDSVYEKTRAETRLKNMGAMSLSDENMQILVYEEVVSITEFLDINLAQYPSCGLVIIDPFAMVMGNKNTGDTYYHSDKKIIDPLRNVTQKYGVCLLLVHHTCKCRENRNFVDKVSGSYSITGAVDTILLMDSNNFCDIKQLMVCGRDVPDMRLLIAMQDCKWHRVKTVQQPKRIAYDTDPLVITLRQLLAVGKDCWRGTSGELITKCNEIAGMSPVDANPAAMSRYINKLSDQLLELDGILHCPPAPNGSNGKRLHSFRRLLQEGET